MEQHILHLTSQQLNKFKKGTGFQLSHNQLTANAGKHQVQVHLMPPDLNKLVKNIQAGKGFRFTQKNVKGGSIMSFVKKIIPKDVAKMGLNALADVAGLATTGTPIGLMAMPMINNMVDHVYDAKSMKDLKNNALKSAKDFAMQQGNQYAQQNYPDAYNMYNQAKSMNPERFQQYANQYAQQHMPSNPYGDFRGYSGRGLKKGSPEMREKMARLRAMRKGKNGAGLFQTIHAVKSAFTPKNMKDKAITYGIPAITGTLGATAGSSFGPAGTVLGSAAGSYAGKQIADQLNGTGIHPHRIHVKGGNLVRGVPKPVFTRASLDKINTHGLIHQSVNGLMRGGSFLSP